MVSANFAGFYGPGGTDVSGVIDRGARQRQQQEDEARRRAAANRGEAFGIARQQAGLGAQPDPEGDALRSMLSNLAQTGGAAGARSFDETAARARAADQASAAAGARALQNQVRGANAGVAQRGFDLRNLGQQQADVMTAGRDIDDRVAADVARAGASQLNAQLAAAGQLQGLRGQDTSAQRQAAQQLIQLLLAEQFDPQDMPLTPQRRPSARLA